MATTLVLGPLWEVPHPPSRGFTLGPTRRQMLFLGILKLSSLFLSLILFGKTKFYFLECNDAL